MCWRFQEETQGGDPSAMAQGVGKMRVVRLELREPAFVLLRIVTFGHTQIQAARTNPCGNAYHADLMGESPRWARMRNVLRMRHYQERAALHSQAALALPQGTLCPLGQIR